MILAYENVLEQNMFKENDFKGNSMNNAIKFSNDFGNEISKRIIS